ncbi:MAG: hypothetical protein DRG24_04240 [Epsilonproteobacteria bacterium]|nr:MAG: hypothetical protein DRG24_04240 [Campylobacterota bacterium]
MRVPKGFAKNYFTLSAIQAHSTQPVLQQISSRTETYRLQIPQEDETLLEEDDLELLIESATLSLPVHGGSPRDPASSLPLLNNHTHQNLRQKRLIDPYLFSNSTLSPPHQTCCPSNILNIQKGNIYA